MKLFFLPITEDDTSKNNCPTGYYKHEFSSHLALHPYQDMNAKPQGRRVMEGYLLSDTFGHYPKFHKLMSFMKSQNFVVKKSIYLLWK